jgi:hypothetical protein
MIFFKVRIYFFRAHPKGHAGMHNCHHQYEEYRDDELDIAHGNRCPLSVNRYPCLDAYTFIAEYNSEHTRFHQENIRLANEIFTLQQSND